MIFDASLDQPFGGAHSPDDSVWQIIRLLRNANDDEYDTSGRPRVKNYWDDAQSERGPGADQPAILYVWSPTGTSIERFSRDETHFDESDTIEVQVWSLNERTTQRLQRNVTRVLAKYLDDNRINTPYSTVQPTTESDFREQKPARTTNHYVMSVEIETRGLQPTRDIDSTAFESTLDDGFA